MALWVPHISTPSDASYAFLKTRWRPPILTPRTCVSQPMIVLEMLVDRPVSVLELVGPDQVLTTRKTDDRCIRLLRKHGMALMWVWPRWADVALQRKILAGSFKYDPRRILVSEEDAIACSPYLFSRSFRLKVQTEPTMTAEPVPAPRMRTIS